MTNKVLEEVELIKNSEKEVWDNYTPPQNEKNEERIKFSCGEPVADKHFYLRNIYRRR